MFRMALLVLLLACVPAAAQMTVTIEGTPAGGPPLLRLMGQRKA